MKNVKAARGFFSLCLAIVFTLCAPAFGADHEFRGRVEPVDFTTRILAYYVEEFSPEELILSINGPPDANGSYRDIYMNLTGVMIGGVRVDKLVFRMNYAQFEIHPDGEVECLSVVAIYARCLVREDDINRKLAEETFGRDDRWENIHMRISPSGLRARGNYIARILFIPLNISIEIESGLRIVAHRELWLNDYTLRVNALDVPDYITSSAIRQIQPLLDLGRFPLPLSLHSVEFQEGQAAFSTRIPPEPMRGGITYRYRAE